MSIEIYNKNFALVATIESGNTSVPRVGEFIALPRALRVQVDNLTHALVHEVEWVLSDAAELTPVVRCHATGQDISNRLLRLEEQGWLQPRN